MARTEDGGIPPAGEPIQRFDGVGWRERWNVAGDDHGTVCAPIVCAEKDVDERTGQAGTSLHVRRPAMPNEREDRLRVGSLGEHKDRVHVGICRRLEKVGARVPETGRPQLGGRVCAEIGRQAGLRMARPGRLGHHGDHRSSCRALDGDPQHRGGRVGRGADRTRDLAHPAAPTPEGCRDLADADRRVRQRSGDELHGPAEPRLIERDPLQGRRPDHFRGGQVVDPTPGPDRQDERNEDVAQAGMPGHRPGLDPIGRAASEDDVGAGERIDQGGQIRRIA